MRILIDRYQELTGGTSMSIDTIADVEIVNPYTGFAVILDGRDPLPAYDSESPSPLFSKTFVIVARDGGLEVLQNGKTIWSSVHGEGEGKNE